MALQERYVMTTGDNTDAQATYNAAVDVAHACSLTVGLKYAVAGDRVNICSGSYTRSVDDTVTNAGTVGNPIVFRGVAADGSALPVNRTSGNGPLVTTNWPVLAYSATKRMSYGTAYIVWDTVVVTGSYVGTLWNIVNGAACVVRALSVTNALSNASATAISLGGAEAKAIDCDCSNTGITNASYTILANSATSIIIGCRVQNAASSGSGLIRTSNFCTIAGCTLLPSAGIGILLDNWRTTTIYGNTIYSQATACIAGPNSASSYSIAVVNNMLTDSGRALLNQYNATAPYAVVCASNRTRDNTSADLGFGNWPYWGAVTTDTGGPETDYVNAAGGDMRLIVGSPARNAGLPLYRDIGALQHEADVSDAAIAQVVWEYADRTLTA